MERSNKKLHMRFSVAFLVIQVPTPLFLTVAPHRTTTQGKGNGMKEEWIAYVLKQTLQGLKYFHDQGQVRATLLQLIFDVHPSLLPIRDNGSFILWDVLQYIAGVFLSHSAAQHEPLGDSGIATKNTR